MQSVKSAKNFFAAGYTPANEFLRYSIPQGWGTFFYGKRKCAKKVRCSVAAGAIASYASAASFKYNVALTVH